MQQCWWSRPHALVNPHVLWCVFLLRLRPQGVVDLVVKVAQLSDPHSLAARQGGTSDIAAARAARGRAYQHLLGVLKPLVLGTETLAAPTGAAAAAAGSDGGAGGQAAGKALTAAEMKAAKQAVIQVCLLGCQGVGIRAVGAGCSLCLDMQHSQRPGTRNLHGPCSC